MRKVQSELELRRNFPVGSKATSWQASSCASKFTRKTFLSTSKSFTVASPDAIAKTFPERSMAAEFAGCRPEPNTRTCNEGACGNTCGDGILNKDEYCDTGIDQCCKNDCSGWKTNTACTGTNPVVDAAVMDYDQRLFLFQGDQFTVYANMDATTPLEGYPKPISTIEDFPASWASSGIDSAASYYDDIVFLHKGLQFVVVDLGEMQAAADNAGNVVREVTDYFPLTTQFQNCGKIDAILSYYWTLDFICDDIKTGKYWKGFDKFAVSLLVAVRGEHAEVSLAFVEGFCGLVETTSEAIVHERVAEHLLERGHGVHLSRRGGLDGRGRLHRCFFSVRHGGVTVSP